MSITAKTEAASSFFGQKLTLSHKMTRRSIVAAGLVALGLAGLWGLYAAGQQSPVATAASEAERPARLLRVSTMKLADIRPPRAEQVFTGIVQARRRSRLGAKVVGRVEAIHADIGEKVKEGDLLLELDRATLMAQRDVLAANLQMATFQLDELIAGPRAQEIEQAESRVEELLADLDLAQANLQRASDLQASSAISQQEIDERQFRVQGLEHRLAAARQQWDLLKTGTRNEQIDAQRASVNSLQAQLDQLQVALDEQAVLAPFDGTIQERWVDPGTVISPGQALMELVESGHQELHVGLPVELADQLEDFQITARAKGDALPAVPVVVERVSPVVDDRTRTVLCIFVPSGQRPDEPRGATEKPSHLDAPWTVGQALELRLGRRESPLSAQLATTAVSERVVEVSPSMSRAYWLPRRALTSGPRGLWNVMVAVPDTADSPSYEPVSADGQRCQIERRPVELLRAEDDWSQVRGILGPGDQVVVDGVHRIVPEQFVEATRWQQPAGLVSQD